MRKPGDEDRYHPQPRDPPTARLKEEDTSEDLSVNFYGSELYLKVIRISFVNQFQILCIICESVSVPVYDMYHTILPLVPDGTITFVFAFILIHIHTYPLCSPEKCPRLFF